jgi:chromosome segregation ATPase
MRLTILMTAMLLCLTSLGAYAAEKGKSQAQIDAVRVTIDAFASKVGDNKDAAGDLAQARSFLKKAEEVLEKGLTLIWLGNVKPEAEQDIAHYTGMAELAVTLAGSHLEKSRAEAELESLTKQTASVKAKLKAFEDRKAELEKLKAEAAKYQGIGKELEGLKAEKAELAKKNEEFKAENSRLNEQLEKLQAERAALAAQLAEARKGTPRPEAVVAPPASSPEKK